MEGLFTNLIWPSYIVYNEFCLCPNNVAMIGDVDWVTEAKSDLVNVLSRLEGHWVVLEAELVEINKDIAYCETCIQKYG
jgi:hypothetical protein